MRTITYSVLLALCLAPLAAFAEKGARRGERDQRHEEVQRRIRTMRAVSLANHLDLDEREALRLNQMMSEFDGRRDALRDEVKSNMRTLRKASEEENPDAQTVDAAIEGVLQGRQKMEALQQEEVRALMKGLTARQRARLAVFLKKFPDEVRRAMKKNREHRRRRHERGKAEGGF